jgi:uncharacterized FlaG/YvyC family protein
MDVLLFDDHARDEMQRDSVSEDEVYHVVEDADEEFERDDGRVRYECILEDGRQIVVIVDDATRTVKTVWWNKRGSRRSRR